MGTTAGFRVPAQQQVRLDERALLGAIAGSLEVAFATHNQLTGLEQFLDVGFHILQLVDGGQCTHADAFDRGITHGDLGKLLFQLVADRVYLIFRNEDTTNGGTFLTGLGGHLAPDFLYEDVEFFVLRGHVRRQNGTVQ